MKWKDEILEENLRRVRAYNKASGYFELDSKNTQSTSTTRNLYAVGSFKDPTVYLFKNKVTQELLTGTMKEIASISLKHKWHRGSWCGTQLVQRVGSQRSILTYLGVAK